MEAFGFLSESLGGSRSRLDGFVSIRADDVTMDFGKMAIQLDDIHVNTGHGKLFEFDDEFSLKFSLDALEAMVPGENSIQYQFDLYSRTSLLHNSSSPHAVAVFSQAYMEHQYKRCMGGAGSTQLTSINHPLPLTNKQSLEIKVMLSVLAGLFILIPFCYIPATFIVFLVRER
jgi:hypothetical protein